MGHYCYVRPPKEGGGARRRGGARKTGPSEEERVELEMFGNPDQLVPLTLEDEDAVDETEAATTDDGEKKIFYADFEAEILRTQRHVPQLLIVQDQHGVVERVFEGSDCADQYVKELVDNESYHDSTHVFHGYGE